MRVTKNMAKWAARIESMCVGFMFLIISVAEPHIMEFVLLIVLLIPFIVCRAIENVYDDDLRYTKIEKERSRNGKAS